MKRFVIAAISLSTLSVLPALAVDYRWTQGFGQGTLEAVIKNRAGSSLNIYCPSGATDTTPGLILETKSVKAAKGKMLDIQVVVDGDNHPFNLDDRMMYSAAGRGFLNNLVSLVDALRKSKSKTFIIEYPQAGKSESFSVQGAANALGNGKVSILSGCE